MQPVADKEVKFNDGRKNLNNKCIGSLVALIVSQTSLGIDGIAVKRKPTLPCDIQRNEQWASNQGAEEAQTTSTNA